MERYNAFEKDNRRNNKNIREGDNGGACVIMDSRYYKERIMKLLNDVTYPEIKSENIKIFIIRLKGWPVNMQTISQEKKLNI